VVVSVGVAVPVVGVPRVVVGPVVVPGLLASRGIVVVTGVIVVVARVIVPAGLAVSVSVLVLVLAGVGGVVMLVRHGLRSTRQGGSCSPSPGSRQGRCLRG